MAKGKPRQTDRKAMIQRVLDSEFPNRPVLLEELRWRVLIGEMADDFDFNGYPDMSISYTKSFARTIRDHMPHLAVYKIRHPDHIPVGILARAAVYRCLDGVIMSRLNSTEPLFCLIQHKTPRQIDHNNLGNLYVDYEPDSDFLGFRDRRSMAYFWFCSRLAADYDESAIFKKCIPLNLNLTYVSTPLYYETFIRSIKTKCPLYRITSGERKTFTDLDPEIPLFTPSHYHALTRAYCKRERYSGVPYPTLLKRVVRHEGKKLVIKPKKK